MSLPPHCSLTCNTCLFTISHAIHIVVVVDNDDAVVIIFYLQTTNAQFQYFLGPSVSVPFAVDPVTGVISVSSALDYETTQDYELTVRN